MRMRAFFCFLLKVAPGLFNKTTGFFTTPRDSKRGKGASIRIDARKIRQKNCFKDLNSRKKLQNFEFQELKLKSATKLKKMI